MKRAVILHGKGSDHTSNWYSWLKRELEKLDMEVWLPDLPNWDQPNAKTGTQFLLDSGWDFNDSFVIGHSAGAVEILHLLQSLPEKTKANTAVLVGSFTEELSENPEWKELAGLFTEPFDFSKIKSKAKRLIFVHSDDDPICPLKQAEELHSKLGGEFVLIPHAQHFSISRSGSRFKKFPELLDIIKTHI